MSQKPKLLVDFCSYQAAKFAVEHWHYSGTMPVGKLVKLGVWEDGRFIGCVLFGRGNSPTLGAMFGVDGDQVCELVRVALMKHASTVTRVVAWSLRLLKATNPGLRLVISFADPGQSHNGVIYQAGNWIFTGQSDPSWQWLHNGKWKHNRQITSGAFGKGGAIANYKVLPKRLPLGKYRYIYGLDRAMRRQIAPLAQPYPKRADG